MRDQDGSDLLLVAGLPPLARVKGQVSRLRGDALSGEDIEAAVSPVVPSRLRERYRDGEAIDLAFTFKGLGRFRMNLHRERGRPAAAIRALPTRIPRVIGSALLARHRAARRTAARAGPRLRTDRLRQDDDAGRAHRPRSTRGMHGTS